MEIGLGGEIIRNKGNILDISSLLNAVRISCLRKSQACGPGPLSFLIP